MQIWHQITLAKKKKMDEIELTKNSSGYEIPYSKLPQCDMIIGIAFAYRNSLLSLPKNLSLLHENKWELFQSILTREREA